MSTDRLETPVAPTPAASAAVDVSVVLPCLNEAGSVGICVRRALQVLHENKLVGEVIVVDNGSTDDSKSLARDAGAHVVFEPNRGYGNAYLAGLAQARGRYIVMADADASYDLNEITRFVEHLDAGADFVIGNRMSRIHDGAMPWTHRYIGNPLMTWLLNVFTGAGVSDAWCGMRAVRRSALPRLGLTSPGMEFALEMVMRARQRELTVAEVPIELHPRIGASKLSTVTDGWRALRYMLTQSPTYLFLVPALLMIGIGSAAMLTVLAQVPVFGRPWFLHTMIAGSFLVLAGVQVLGLGVCARTYARNVLKERDPVFDYVAARTRLEHGLGLGLVFGLVGLFVDGLVLVKWITGDFGPLGYERLALLGSTLIVVGIQVFFTSFLISVLTPDRSRG